MFVGFVSMSDGAHVHVDKIVTDFFFSALSVKTLVIETFLFNFLK